MALMSETGLVVRLIRLDGGRALPKDHLAGQVIKVGVHGQRQPELIGEKILRWDLRTKQLE